MPLSKNDVMILIGGIIAAIYLLNPTFGMFELIPDNIPIIGNLDEAAATAVLLYALKHFGLDVFSLVDRARNPRRNGRND